MHTVDLYLRVRLACHVDGLSQREAASRFGIARETVRKMLRHSEPPGYRRRQPPKRPKLAPFTDIIDRILEEDRPVHRKQHHTAKRIFGHQRLGRHRRTRHRRRRGWSEHRSVRGRAGRPPYPRHSSRTKLDRRRHPSKFSAGRGVPGSPIRKKHIYEQGDGSCLTTSATVSAPQDA